MVVREHGVTIYPIAFLVIQSNSVKLMPVNHSSCIDRLLDYMPDLMERTNNMMNRIVNNKKEETEKILKEMQKRSNNSKSKTDSAKQKDVEKELKNEKEQLKKNVDKVKDVEELDYEYEYDDTQDD